MEVGDGAEAAVEPRGVRSTAARGGTGLALFDEALVHRGAYGFYAEHDERVIEVAVRVAEGRHEDDCACGACLVMVVDDLRIPDAGEDAVDVGGLGLVAGEEVAIVIVADVLLPETRHAVEQALGRVRVAHVPAGDELHAVGIGKGAEHDVVMQEAHRLGIGLGVELVDGLDELLGADGL